LGFSLLHGTGRGDRPIGSLATANALRIRQGVVLSETGLAARNEPVFRRKGCAPAPLWTITSPPQTAMGAVFRVPGGLALTMRYGRGRERRERGAELFFPAGVPGGDILSRRSVEQVRDRVWEGSLLAGWPHPSRCEGQSGRDEPRAGCLARSGTASPEVGSPSTPTRGSATVNLRNKFGGAVAVSESFNRTSYRYSNVVFGN
jgi:hypothetical protein